MKRRGPTHQSGTTTRLIKEGGFPHTRNPMYVGMTAMPPANVRPDYG